MAVQSGDSTGLKTDLMVCYRVELSTRDRQFPRKVLPNLI